MGVEGRQGEMLLDPAQSGVNIADQYGVADGRAVVVDNGAAQADDLLAQFLAQAIDFPIDFRVQAKNT